MNNKNENFYNYMGKFFGSRIVQSETKDRIYDDNNKTWYVYLDKNQKPCAFLSVCNNIIKNIYGSNERGLIELLEELSKDSPIEPSIVTTLYEKVYKKCGFRIIKLDTYKHFIMIQKEACNV